MKDEDMPEGFRQLVEQARKANADKPGPKPTEEEAERFAAQLRESLSVAKAQTDAITAKGGPEARMEAAMVLIEAMSGVLETAGIMPKPVDGATGLDRKPTLERNGRSVVTGALDEATLRDAPVEVLVERYADLAIATHHAIEHGRITRHNRLLMRRLAIAKALAAREPDARTALLPLLDDSDPGVRSAAAHDCREIAPERAKP